MRKINSILTRGFTIVELLIVIIVIGILASLVLVGYSNIQTQARSSKIKNDLSELSKAIGQARNNEGKAFFTISSNGYTAAGCVSKAAGTDLAALSRTDTCWTTYTATINRISAASGMELGLPTDPWGRPYFIDENEGEGGWNCNRDKVSVYAYPFSGATLGPEYAFIPTSGFTGCPLI